MFKTLVGRGHPEFSTKRQQDAQEYLLHLLAMVEVSLLLWYGSLACFSDFVVVHWLG